MSHRRAQFIAASAGMFVFGIALAILGVLFGLPAMRERIHADLAQQGDILLILYLGVLISTIIVGPVSDSFGYKIVLTLSAAFVLAGFAGLAIAASFVQASIAALVLGVGGGGLNTASNALVADLYPESRGAMLNLVAVFFGLGALLAPLIGVLVPRHLAAIAAVLAALCTIFYLFLPFPRPADAAGFSIFASIKAANTPGVMLLAFLLFCESGNESAIGGWTSTYAGSIGAAPRVATWILALYWAGLMLGRIAGAQVLSRVRKERWIFLSGVGSAIGMAVLLATPSLAMMAIGSVLIGFSFAAIYPTTLAIAADRYQRLAGTIFGLLFAVGLIGGMIFPWAVGHLSEHFGVRAAMVLPIFGAIAIMLLVTAIGRDGHNIA